jgi:hypothetical protein
MTMRRPANRAAATGALRAKSRQTIVGRATELTKSGRDSGDRQVSGDSRMLIAMFAVTQAVAIGLCVGALVMHPTETRRPT